MHLLLAAGMWSTVGSVLAVVGIRWLLVGGGEYQWLLLAVAVVLGLCKSLFVLRSTARRVVRRIIARGDGRCIGGFVSWKTWLLIAVMIVSGWILRNSELAIWIIGIIYTGIGSALVISSLTIWKAWRFSDHQAGSNTG